jgi:hypothetical protein
MKDSRKHLPLNTLIFATTGKFFPIPEVPEPVYYPCAIYTDINVKSGTGQPVRAG